MSSLTTKENLKAAMQSNKNFTLEKMLEIIKAIDTDLGEVLTFFSEGGFYSDSDGDIAQAPAEESQGG